MTPRTWRKGGRCSSRSITLPKHHGVDGAPKVWAERRLVNGWRVRSWSEWSVVVKLFIYIYILTPPSYWSVMERLERPPALRSMRSKKLHWRSGVSSSCDERGCVLRSTSSIGWRAVSGLATTCRALRRVVRSAARAREYAAERTMNKTQQSGEQQR